MSRIAVLGAWALLAAALVGCELVSLATHGRYASLEKLLERITARTGWFLATFVGWMWLGWHLFAR